MRRPLLITAAAVGLLVLLAGLAAVPFVVSVEGFQRQIEARAFKATGRELHINGGLNFTLLPQPSFTARDVTLANLPGGHSRALVHVASMRLDAKMLPLFWGQVEVTDIVLDHPQIALEVSRDGTANWTVVRQKTGEDGVRLPRNTTLGTITIRDGRVSYDNDKLAIHRTVDDFAVRLALSTADAPIDLQGSFELNAQHFALKTHLATLKSLTAGKPTRINLNLDSALLQTSFDGTMARDGSADGTATLSTPSLKALSAWAGRPIAAGDGLGALSLKANVSVSGHRYGLSQAHLTLDGMTMTGNVAADLGGKIPVVDGALAIDRLNLNLYLGAGHQHGGTKHAPHQVGWSKSPFSLSVLKLFNGRLKLDAGAIEIRKLKLGRSVFAVALKDGSASVQIAPAHLYGGSAKADLQIDASQDVPKFAATLDLAAVATQPLMEQIIGVDKLDATGNAVLTLTATGNSPDAVMHSLSGHGSLSLARGRIYGINLGGTARSIAAFLGGGRNGEDLTEFDTFHASFTMRDGFLATNDITLAGPVVHATGAGSIDLGNQALDLGLNPRVSIGGRSDFADLAVPVTIAGPWSHVSIKADTDHGAVTGLFGNAIKGGIPLGKLLGNLFGGHKHHDQPPPDDY
ncbi:MAG TPA: AsmA family protein [Rhizomicrobium sp.]|nr:AsmA family protein [Rhizomicrobium sp.]